MKNNALDRFLKDNDKIFKDRGLKHRGLPYLGRGVEKKEFSGYTKRVEEAFGLLGDGLGVLVNEKNKNKTSHYLIGGDPIEFPMFPLCKEYMEKCINRKDLYVYTSAKGDNETKGEIIEYFIREGIKSPRGLNIDNITFTMATTQAFDVIIKTIARPYDVVLMTGPTYGLFTFIPERNGVNTEILPLSQIDGWFINPKKLSKSIDNINKKLIEKYSSLKLSYQPRVVAFFNANPNNPIGSVMGNRQKELLRQIGRVCKEKGVFVIDDIIYRDLTFDRDNIALPMATMEELFDNVITITGLSKSYGLASIRAGVVLANENIIEAINNYTFHVMDSLPIIQQRALAGAFNASDKRYRCYNKYFSSIIEQYKYRLELLKALVNGVKSISNLSMKLRIERDIKKANLKNEEEVLKGIPKVDFVKGTMAQSGFFSLLDFTKLKGTKYGDRTITTEEEIFKYMYEQEKIKVLIGKSFAWSEKDKQLVVRVTFALESLELIQSLGAMNSCLRKLQEKN
ncbi:MAG: pyridoxal phosphate-dependent aminotransferase [Clostridia bacterium]|nr:pyridoxal phosphate-dependent aminotransferase [Clostridia bacterium]